MSRPRDYDIHAVKEEDIFNEARDRLLIAQEAETDNRNRAKDDLQFCEGEEYQWDSDVTSTESEASPQLTINLTDALVQRVVNNMKQQRPRGKCHPVGDGADIEIAGVINGIGRHVETRSEASVAYDTAGEMAVKCGWGYWRIVSEYLSPDSFDQDLRILPIRNIFTVYMDPGAIMPTAQDAGWALISVMMKRTEYKRRYPNAENASWKDTGAGDTEKDWENKEEIRLAEYFRITERAETLYLLKSASGDEIARFESELPTKDQPGRKVIDEDRLAVVGLSLAREEDGDIVMRESARRTVEWFRLNGRKVVERATIPGEFIPIIRCEGHAVDIDGKVMRRGMVRAMQDAQRMVNYGEVAKIKRLGLAPKAPWVVAAGQIDGQPEWTDANLKAYPVLTYKPVTVSTAQGDVLLPPPQRQPPPQIEAGFSEFVGGMRTNLLAIAGMPNEPGADKQGQVVSGVALDKRQGLSDQSHYQYYDNQTLAIAHTWRIMLSWIPHYFSEKRLQRIIGEDGVPQVITINEPVKEGEGDSAVSRVKNDISVGRYDVVMDTGPGYETKRQEGAENLINLMKVPALAEIVAKVAPDLIFRSIDHPYMEEIADRLSAQTPEGLKKILAELPARARSIIEAIANQNQQLQQALQAAQTGITKAHLAATVKAHDTERRAEQAERDTLVRAHTELAREDIAGGVQLLKTGMEHAHERAQAQEMIKRGEAAETGTANGSGNNQ